MATNVIWDDTYSVGVAEIDVQHKKLFDLYNGFLEAYRIGDENIVNYAFEEMASYLDTHFSFEEEFWQRDDEMYQSHRRLHFDFVKYVLSEKGKGDKLESLESLLEFLSTWLIEHIQNVDKLQFQQLRDKGLL